MWRWELKLFMGKTVALFQLFVFIWRWLFITFCVMGKKVSRFIFEAFICDAVKCNKKWRKSVMKKSKHSWHYPHQQINHHFTGFSYILSHTIFQLIISTIKKIQFMGDNNFSHFNITVSLFSGICERIKSFSLLSLSFLLAWL